MNPYDLQRLAGSKPFAYMANGSPKYIRDMCSIKIDCKNGCAGDEKDCENCKYENTKGFLAVGVCSVCDKESYDLKCAYYDIERTILCKYKSQERLLFIDICSTCSDYIRIATCDDVIDLHKKVSSKKNPFRKNKEKNRSIFGKIKNLFNDK